jgi:hypothetical protein
MGSTLIRLPEPATSNAPQPPPAGHTRSIRELAAFTVSVGSPAEEVTRSPPLLLLFARIDETMVSDGRAVVPLDTG